MTAPSPTEQAIAEVLLQHQRIPCYDGTYSNICTCGHMRATDGPNSPRHAAHVAEQIAPLVDAARAEALRQAAERGGCEVYTPAHRIEAVSVAWLLAEAALIERAERETP